MRAPKGFGKNYFTFASVQAYSSAIKLDAISSSSQEFLYNKISNEDDLEEDPPDTSPLSSIILENSKVCHCNCYFKKIIRLILLLNHFIPRCPFYNTFFAFRRTGVHPPSVLLYKLF